MSLRWTRYTSHMAAAPGEAGREYQCTFIPDKRQWCAEVTTPIQADDPYARGAAVLGEHVFLGIAAGYCQSHEDDQTKIKKALAQAESH